MRETDREVEKYRPKEFEEQKSRETESEKETD